MQIITTAIRTLDAKIELLTAARQALVALSEIAPDPVEHSTQSGKRHLSAKARRRIARAQKARWAKWHKAQKGKK